MPHPNRAAQCPGCSDYTDHPRPATLEDYVCERSQVPDISVIAAIYAVITLINRRKNKPKVEAIRAMILGHGVADPSTGPVGSNVPKQKLQ
jgi:hypothetical protein